MKQQGCSVEGIPTADLNKVRALIVGEGMLKDERYQRYRSKVTLYVKNGGTLIVIEPEYGVDDREEIPVLDALLLTVERRKDHDKGGYDSYVFPEDYHHPLWRGIEKKHLQMFNGALGGEMVSQHDIWIAGPHTILARCGLHLSVVAAAEIAIGSGKVIISRIQSRGRLVGNHQSGSIYERRTDPVAQRYILNLVWYASKLSNVSANAISGERIAT